MNRRAKYTQDDEWQRHLRMVDRMNAEIDRARDQELAEIDRMNAEYSARNRER